VVRIKMEKTPESPQRKRQVASVEVKQMIPLPLAKEVAVVE
jgi:hypothetical protein